MPISPTVLGNRLREARESRQITRDDAARVIGASEAAIAQIESAERSLSTWELSELAQLYRRSVSDLFADGTGANREQTPLSIIDRLLKELTHARENADELIDDIIRLSIEAYRREEVSRGWLRDLSVRLEIPAEDLIELAEANMEDVPLPKS